jgi:hypothetical protein
LADHKRALAAAPHRYATSSVRIHARILLKPHLQHPIRIGEQNLARFVELRKRFGIATLVVQHFAIHGVVANRIDPARGCRVDAAYSILALVLSVCLLIFMIHNMMAMIPVAVPPAVELLFRELGWLTFVPINLLLSLVIVATLCFLYQLSLDGLGELLERREQAILQIVTQEVE